MCVRISFLFKVGNQDSLVFFLFVLSFSDTANPASILGGGGFSQAHFLRPTSAAPNCPFNFILHSAFEHGHMFMMLFSHSPFHLGVLSLRNSPFVFVKGARVCVDSLGDAWGIVSIFVRHKHG